MLIHGYLPNDLFEIKLRTYVKYVLLSSKMPTFTVKVSLLFQGKHREGRVIGAVQPHVEDGFTKSEKLHSLGTGEKWDPSDQLRNQVPYQAKSIKSRDVFFDDHTHDAKNKGYVLPSADKDAALRPVMNIQKPRLQPFEYDPVFTGVKVGTPRQRHTQHWSSAHYQPQTVFPLLHNS